MDQLRKAWGWFQRQHFWVLIVVAVLVAVGCWYRGATALWAEYETNKNTINSGFSSANNVSGKPSHANLKVQEAQAAEIAKQQETVSALWQELYDRQTASVLKWPSNLSDEFREYIAKKSFGEDIHRDLRAHYNNYIRDHFPELPKIVGALEEPESGSPGGGGMGRGAGGPSVNIANLLETMRGGGRGARGGMEGAGSEMMEEPDFLVVWADQQLIRGELSPRSTPSSKRIWKTQEDVWVYEALLHIIANTNKAAGADRFSNAAIRVIESLEVGRTAAQASRGKGRIDIVESAAAGAGGEGMGGEFGMEGGGMGRGGEIGMEGGAGMEGGYMGRGAEMGMGMEGGRGGMDPGAADAELLNNRYVNSDGAPIADAGDGNAAAFGTEFKRLPVRMRLWMDQRWLPHLIAECASAPLQVEVQEVRVNVSDEAGGGGGYGGRGGGGGRGGEGYGMGGVAGGEEMTPEAEPNMKSIVLQGTVYIFNPPTAQPAVGADGSLAATAEQ